MEGVTFDGFDWTTRRLGLLFEVVLYWDMFGFDSWFDSSTVEAIWDMTGSDARKRTATLQHDAV
jgi:hypothetical protein